MHYRNDPNHYLSIPTRTADLTTSLARALLTAAPTDPAPAVDKRIEKIRAKSLDLHNIWTAASSQETEISKRAADTRLDRCWAASSSRVSSWIDIDDEDHREDAERVMAAVFPTGLDFLRLTFRSEWAESDRRLKMLAEDEELGAMFENLVDARLVKRLHEAHTVYGKVLGITVPDGPSEGRLIDAITALRTELVGYARLVIGLTDDDDAEAVAETERWLAPILEFRESGRRRGKGKGEAEAPSPDEVEAPSADEVEAPSADDDEPAVTPEG